MQKVIRNDCNDICQEVPTEDISIGNLLWSFVTHDLNNLDLKEAEDYLESLHHEDKPK